MRAQHAHFSGCLFDGAPRGNEFVVGARFLGPLFARPAAWTVHPHVGPILTRLGERGIVTGIGSNLDARLYDVVAGHAELRPLAGRVIVSGVVGWRKPSPRFFDAVIGCAGCDKPAHEMNQLLDGYVGDYQI